MNKKVELLAPAGDKERAYYALNYGADAIFLGAKMFSLRARASNFAINDIAEIVNYAHSINKKVYLVTNVICHNALAKEFNHFFKQVADLKIDGFICADPFIIKTISEYYPQCEIHISTQQSITNSKAALFFKKFNVTRIVLAREMKFDEIASVIDVLRNILEVEIFIHGAVCIAYSGRCMMSNNFSFRDSNVGGCAQSCRWHYQIENKKNFNHFFTMSAKDMTYIWHLDKLLDLKPACFKIEGRMKSLNYITAVTKAYRGFIDNYYKQKKLNHQHNYNELLAVANRDFDDAFLINANYQKMLYHDEAKKLLQNYLFIVKEKIDDYTFIIITKNYLDINMKISLLTPNNEITLDINEISVDNNKVNVIHTPMTEAVIKFNQPVKEWLFGIGKKDEK